MVKGVVALAGVLCILSACPDPYESGDDTPGGGQSNLTCGQQSVGCGCWGPADGTPQFSAECESGLAVAQVCGGACPLGGATYRKVCYCGSQSPDGGQGCSTIHAAIGTVGSPAIACGAPGPTTLSIMADINTMWQSQVSSCACDTPDCPFNAWVLGQTPGYVYYRRDFLQWISNAAGGSIIGAAWMLSHENGHALQVAYNIPASSGKAKELGADCLSGYFLAWLECSGKANMNDAMSAAMAVCAAGDPSPSTWFDPGAHGTCSERQIAVQRGIDGYRENRQPSTWCAF